MELSDFEVIRQRPYICQQNGVVMYVNDLFFAMTGYSNEELIGKNVLYILNNLLRLTRKVTSINTIASDRSCFLFTKQLDFKEICFEEHRNADNDAMYIIFIQKPFVSINNPLSYTQQLISDNLSGIAIYSADNFTLLKASKEYEKIIYERDRMVDVIGKRVDEFFIDWEGSLAQKVWESAIQTKKTRYSLEHERPNLFTGEIEYYDASVTPIVDGDRVKFLVVSLNNITDKVNLRKENEKNALVIKKQKELLEAVIEKQRDYVIIVDKLGNIILNNKAAYDEYAEHLSTIGDLYAAAEYFDEAGNQLSFEQFPVYRLIRGEKLENYRLVFKREDYTKHLNLNGTPIFDELGSFEHAFLFGTDITEIIESRQMVIQQKEQLEAIVSNMSDAIFIVDKDERFIIKNNAANSRFHNEPHHLRDVFDEVKFYEKDGQEIPFNDSPAYHMLQGKTVTDRVIVMKSSDKKIYLSVNCNPIHDKDGKFAIGVISSRDITGYMQNDETIKAQQKALLMAEKKEKESLERLIVMKDEFLSLISHEFKTPLTVINSALQALDLLYKDQMTDKVKSYLDKIKQNTYRQMRLVNNLLDITVANEGHIRLNMQNRDIVFITKVIVESVSIYAQQKGVNISFKSDSSVKCIALDEEKYERIILNLLSNAIKFTPKGKNITVELICSAAHIRIMVMDEGVGIPKEKQELIFERFGQVDNTYTRQVEGTGIGLSLVRQLVHGMGGNVSVESSVEAGSNFIIELPNVVLDDQCTDRVSQGQLDARLIQSIAIEFSDIYL